MRKLILIFVLFLSSLAFADANLVFHADFNDNADTNVVVNQITTPVNIDAIDACYTMIVSAVGDINSAPNNGLTDANGYMIFTAKGNYAGKGATTLLTDRRLPAPLALVLGLLFQETTVIP